MSTPVITSHAVGEALAAAAAVMRAAPRAAPEQVQQARMVWSWLPLSPSETARAVLEARALTGAAWPEIECTLKLPPGTAKPTARRALVAIASRLNEAMAG